MKIAVLFPGQGSQFVGMGQEFIQTKTECAALMAMAEATCELNLGTIIKDGPLEELTKAAIVQPAVTATNLICWQAFKDALAQDIEVSCFAGHSLGEYSALYAAGIISAEDAIRLVSKRGALMGREGERNPGGMRAVLGLDIEAVETLISKYSGDGVVTAANHNAPLQIVLSGSMDALDAVGTMASEQGAKVIPLNVSVANHSPLMDDAVPDFSSFISDIEFKAPQVPVYFNVSGSKETDTETMKTMMKKQIVSRVRWCGIIESMLQEGVDTFIEIGPKPVLKGMMKKIVPKGTKVTSMQFDTPESLSKCIDTLKSA